MFRWVFFAILAVLFFAWLFSKRLPWLEKLGLTKLNSHLQFRLFVALFVPSYLRGSFANNCVRCGAFIASFAV